jgi:tetratricopeptide (TPR) repeat protein/tRNA A-37 threonylcarbamoyl transferase component Bud32
LADVTRLADTTRLATGHTGPATTPVAAADSGPLTIGDRFGRYTIMRLLGIGGMGAVYQAWDKELDVVVALKVIRPEVLRDPTAEQEIERRFKRELLLARQVTHKNVVRIYDLGEIDGIKYITMSYVHGTDLSTLVKREGPLAVSRILKIMRGVVSGLVAAHGAGVVHRDLKPANIMIDADGEALIMDFGIARSTGGGTDVPLPAGATGGKLESLHASKYTEATVLGSIVGTVEYMAPEQALGQPVDQRADVYAVGLILYDLLTGKKRSQQPGTALEQLRVRMERGIPPIKSLAPSVPDPLAAIVMRASETDAAKRFQTTTELADALGKLDEKGELLPVKRTVGLKMMAGIVAAVVALAAGAWWYFGPTGPEKPHDPVVVVISDLQNLTGDAAFDRTLEPMLRRALEGASFITAYDRIGLRRTFGTSLSQKLDEAAARELAVNQGLGVVLAGAIDKQGSGYNLTMKAVDARTGDVINRSSVKGRASNPDQVLPAATKLVTSIRKALGDKTTSESEQIFTMNSVSATSLDVVRHYSAAIEAQTNAKFEDARASALKAVELDPKFGLGYLLLSTVSRNLGRSQDSAEYSRKALSLVDGMTERERFATRGMSYRVTFDYQKCVQEYGELIKRYAADVVGHNQLALCASKLRDLSRAQSEMQFVVNLLPNRTLFRDNLALYASYAGDFETSEQQARLIKEPDVFSRLALGFAQLGKGQLTEAAATFNDMAKTDVTPEGKTQPVYGPRAPSISTSALGDLAIHEGRFSDAGRILEQGATADVAANLPDGAAAKYAAIAYAQTLRGQKAAAIAASTKSLSLSKQATIRFLAARTFIENGQLARAKPLAADLSAELQPEPQAYGKILDGMLALTARDLKGAIKSLTEANALLDMWIGHFELGRAYLAANQFAQADSEFDACLKRRGEALSLFLDEEPTFGYFPSAYYYQGRVREGLGSAGAADSYRKYLEIREKAGEDPLVPVIKKQLGR